MTSTTMLRNLRTKYKIPLSSLAGAAGISVQHLSRLELGSVNKTPYAEDKITSALRSLICTRRKELLSLEQDYLLYRGHLLEPMEEHKYEL